MISFEGQVNMPRGKKQSGVLSDLRSAIGATSDVQVTARLSTGILPIDWALSGGFGYGRAAEVFGGYSSGKSHVILRCLAACQKAGGTAVLIETEGAYDPVYFDLLGGNSDALIVVYAETVEDVFNKIKSICEFALANKLSNVSIGWDSIAMTGTDHLVKVGMDKRDMSKAEAMSRGCSLIRERVRGAGICLVAVNQVREKIDKYASGPQTPGGTGYPFYASQRIETRLCTGDEKQIRDGSNENEILGHRLRVWVEKSKLGPPMRYVKLPFYLHDGKKHPVYGTPTKHGIDEVEALFDFYSKGLFTMPSEEPGNGPRVIEKPAVGWYALNQQFDPSQTKFRAKDWPTVLQDHPELLTYALEI